MIKVLLDQKHSWLWRCSPECVSYWFGTNKKCITKIDGQLSASKMGKGIDHRRCK